MSILYIILCGSFNRCCWVKIGRMTLPDFGSEGQRMFDEDVRPFLVSINRPEVEYPMSPPQATLVLFPIYKDQNSCRVDLPGSLKVKDD